MAFIWEKQTAQENLLSAMQVAFDRLDEETASMKESDKKALRNTMSKQMARVEKLFGFEPYSFSRGC